MTLSPTEYALAYSVGLSAFAFTVSGFGKIADVPGTLRALRALRAPVFLQRRAIAVALPAGELLLAVALVLSSGPIRIVVGAVSALLLIAFTVALVRVLLAGEEVDCGCFGPLSVSDRISGWSVARNVALIAMTVVVFCLGGSDGSVIRMLFSGASSGVLGLCLAWALTLIAVLVREIVIARRKPTAGFTGGTAAAPPREVALLSPESLAMGLDPSRPGEPAMGDPIPAGELVTDHGVTQPLVELGFGRPVLLIFLSTGCGSCIPVAEAVPRWQEALAPFVVRVATSSSPDAVAQTIPGALPFIRYGAGSARQSFGVQRAPAAVVLGGQELPIVASHIAYGIHEIEALVESLAGQLQR